MKLFLSASVLGGVLALPLVALPLLGPSWTSAASSADKITVGSTPSYTFREAPVNAMGTQSLEALRGKPVLVEFWGPN